MEFAAVLDLLSLPTTTINTTPLDMLCSPSTMSLSNRHTSSASHILLSPMSAVVESASTLAPPIETRVVSDDPSLEARSLYAVLTSRNELGAWNWSFYLPNDSDGSAPVGSDGTLFHAVMDSAGVWKFEHEHGYNVVSDPLVVAIVKLASLAFLGPYKDVIGDDGLMAIFGMVPIPNSPSHQPGDFSSRTWFLESIGTLGDCGILTCEDLWLLEREIRRCAFMAMDNFLDLDNRRRTAHNERSWTLYVAQNCS